MFLNRLLTVLVLLSGVETKLLADEDPWTVLGVERGADRASLKAAFKRKALQLHPDKGGDEELFVKLRAAFEALAGARTAPSSEKEQNEDDFFRNAYQEAYEKLRFSAEGFTFETEYNTLRQNDFDLDKVFVSSFSDNSRVIVQGLGLDGKSIYSGEAVSNVVLLPQHTTETKVQSSTRISFRQRKWTRRTLFVALTCAVSLFWLLAISALSALALVFRVSLTKGAKCQKQE